MAKIFDTYKSSVELEKFIDKVIPDGHIIAVACKDDCFTNLSDKCKQWFSDLGSNAIWDLKYRDAFAFIGISGHQDAQEKMSNDEVQITSFFRVNHYER